MHVLKALTRFRCDEPMRRSKEKCYTTAGIHWRCDKRCKECICAIRTISDGTEEHVNLMSMRKYKDDE